MVIGLLSAACSRTQLAEINDNPADREVEFRVDFRAPAVPQSNTGRPLDTTDDLQKVTDVRVYLFRSAAAEGPFTYFKPTYGSERVNYLPISDFSNYVSAQGDETHTYQIKPTLPEGYYYRMLAVGLSKDTEKGITDPTEIRWTEHLTTWGEALATNGSDPMTGRVAESFTGIATDIKTSETTFYVSKDSETIGFDAEVQLYRAVCGVMLYVTHVPAEIDDTPLSRIAILTSGQNTTLDPFSRQITADFIKSPAKVAEISVTNPQPEEKFIAGNFLYPTRTFTEDAEPSLLFGFYTGDSPTPFKTIPIKTVRMEANPGSNDPMDNPDAAISPDGLRFNLLSNHIYCLGMKSKTIDEPIDLTEALKDPEAKIFIMGCYQADIDIPM